MEFSLAEDCSHETLSIKKPLAEEHIYFIYIYVYRRRVWTQETHRVLGFQQIRMNVIYMDYLNTLCHPVHHNNVFMTTGQLVYKGTHMYNLEPCMGVTKCTSCYKTIMVMTGNACCIRY